MSVIAKLSVTLLIVASIAGLAISITNSKTTDKIEFQKKLTEKAALKSLFPDGAKIVSVTDSSKGLNYWIGKKENSVIGYAFKGSGHGYSSDIVFFVAVDSSGTILGLNVVSQSETPGLGTRTQEVVSKKYLWNFFLSKAEKSKPWFSEQFKGIKTAENIIIKKGIEWDKISPEEQKKLAEGNTITAITGATISTRAVLNGVKKCTQENLKLLNLNNGGQK